MPFWKKKETEETTSNVSETVESPRPRRIVYQKLWRAGLIAAVVATLSNLVLYYLGQNLLGTSFLVPVEPGSTELVPLTFADVFLVTIMAAIAATLLLAFLAIPFLGRLIPDPIRLFWAISAFFLFFSFGGPLSLAADGLTTMMLCFMHVMTAVVVVGVLTIFSRGG
jgi:hypothetical protein